jgi:rod shape-determining protein MreC
MLSPIQNGVQSILNPIANSIIGASNYNQIASQNKVLKDQVSRLSKKLKSNQDALERLKELTALENLPYSGSIPKVTAEVISNSISNLINTIEINKGTSDGIGVGMTVVTVDGLVGKIVSAGASTSIVSLITDPNNAVSVVLYFNPQATAKQTQTPTSNASSSNGTTTTNSTTTTSTTTTTSAGTTSAGTPATTSVATTPVFALVNGQNGSDDLTLTFVPPTFSPYINQVVYTASLNGGDYPPGIPVGYISNVSIKPGNLQGSITVHPFVDFSSLTYVDVLQWLPSP